MIRKILRKLGFSREEAREFETKALEKAAKEAGKVVLKEGVKVVKKLR